MTFDVPNRHKKQLNPAIVLNIPSEAEGPWGAAA
jgi:hypothetical protein